MNSRALLVLGLWAVLLGATSVAAQKCSDKCFKASLFQYFPRLSMYTFPTWYGAQAEVQVASDPTTGESNSPLYFREFYHMAEKRASLRLQAGAVSTSITYIQDDNEMFTVQGGVCTRTTLRQKPKFIAENRLRRYYYVGSDRTVYGPSAQLWRGMEVSSKNLKFTAYGGRTKIRGIPATYYLQCDPEEPNVLYRYYFADDRQFVNPDGKFNKLMPLRVTVMDVSKSCTNGSILQSTDFFLFSPFSAKENDFRVPSGLGCKRRGQSDYEIPDYSSTDLLFSGEIIYNDYLNPQKMISNFMTALDMKSQTVLLRTNTLKSADDGSLRDTKMKSTLYYGRAKTAIDLDTCAVRTEEYTGIVQLPDGQKLDLGSSDIFYGRDGFYYLNTEVNQRGVPTLEFEKVFRSLTLGNGTYEAIVTRHYIKDDVYSVRNMITRNAPFNYIIKLRNDKKEVVKEITVNVHSFVKLLDRKEEIFSMSQCAKEEGTHSWIKVEFPIPEFEDRLELFATLGDAGAQFVETVVGNTELTYSRISGVTVDTDMSNVYITAKILQKLPYIYDFDKKPGMTLAQPYESIIALADADECSTRCQEDPKICNAFSVCGSYCVLGYDKIKTVGSQDCTLYERRVANYQETTLRKILLQIEGLVKGGNLVLVLPRKDLTKEPLELRGSVFASDIAKPSPMEKYILDQRFSGLKRGARYKTNAKGVIATKTLPLNQCKTYCLNSGTCESLSYCFSDNTCTISSQHYSELSDDATEDKSMCAIIGRMYLDRFTKTKGFIQIRSAEKVISNTTAQACARACVKETSFRCLSFEMCGSNCSMHTTHLTDLTNGDKNQNFKNCEHYSLNFKFEFRNVAGKVSDDKPDLVLPDVSADSCARSCVHNNGFTCREFDFCVDVTKSSTTGRCLLSQQPASKTSTNALCYRAIREVVNPSEYAYSKNLGIGLGFLFVCIGIALGVGIIFGIGYYQANKR